MPSQVNAIDAAGADYGKSIQSKKKKPTFECPHCSRKFATRSHLVRHSRVHTGERRYACDYPGCEMRCSRKDNLQQHYRTHLVVNPRRANAQSMLNAASTAAGASQDATNDPEAQEASAIHKSNNNIHNGEYADPTRLMGSPTDLKPIPSDASQPTPTTSDNHGLSHLQTSTSLVDVNHHDPTNGPNPDRDWSLSPPPPLSSAYDYWYAHGCLPHTVRNPASVSGSGSSGATSPEISNALELAPGQGGHHQQQHHHHPHQPHPHSHVHPAHHHPQHHPHQPHPPPQHHHLPPHHPHAHAHQPQRHSYVESPTGYYHSHHNVPSTAGGYSPYDGEGGGAMRTYSLGTATFPSPADYHHPAAPHSHHQRSNSHSSYSMHPAGGNAGTSYARMGYESATTSPHISNAHLHHAPHSGLPPPTRHHSYPNAESYESPGGRPATAYNSTPTTTAAAGGYHANSPTEYKFHPHAYAPTGATGAGAPTGVADESRPVTRHGSITGPATAASGYATVPVYPSHPHATTTAAATMGYGVAVDMTSASHGAGTSGAGNGSASGMNSPRGSSLPPPPPLGSSLVSQSSQPGSSLVLPPIRYSDGSAAGDQGTASTPTTATASGVTPYGMMGAGHFTSAPPQNGWERVSISDARALPPHPSAMTR